MAVIFEQLPPLDASQRVLDATDGRAILVVGVEEVAALAEQLVASAPATPLPDRHPAQDTSTSDLVRLMTWRTEGLDDADELVERFPRLADLIRASQHLAPCDPHARSLLQIQAILRRDYYLQ